MRLKDPQLLRDKAYVDGEWVGADSGATFARDEPGERRRPGDVARPARRRNAPRHRSGQRRLARLGREDREGTRAASCANGST